MSNPRFSRMERVNSIIKHVLAEEVELLKDPRLEMVTITGVDTQPNLRNATVYFSTLDLDHSEPARVALESAAPRLRRAMGDQVRLKYTPLLHFELDHGIAGGSRIDRLLQSISTQGDEGEEE